MNFGHSRKKGLTKIDSRKREECDIDGSVLYSVIDID